ncbi:MAG: macro domain-containing protein [Propionibacteriaceae bacterium]|jgi:O-acetyl-ADP-ribose deacetylase (regulator of RNase III)|nr:macro domain-containing protein [Propionibacteriaceae bacterium]
MIETVEGDLLQADVDALVNTVNTEGVMGKGIALQFRRAYPAMYDAYRAACKSGDVRIGHMTVWETGAATGPRYVINFPTKRHWRAKSRLADVEDGLVDLVRVMRHRGITSVAVPPLGAGNGGLPWVQVKDVIVRSLGGLEGVHVLLYEPHGAPDPHQMVTTGQRKPLTEHRAAFVDLVGRYVAVLMDAKPSLIEVQKLMYFLQEAGQPLRLRYARGPYGPYADNLRHVLIDMEGTYSVGFGDGSDRPLDTSLELMDGAAEAAAATLARYPETKNRIDRVMELTSGFDSMYGMELLGTVHWLIKHEGADPSDAPKLTGQIADWAKRKAELFTQPHVEAAVAHLRDLNWV